ncbi:MAG: 50S ribosomal protein L15 [Verrucomicrobia bacterium]|nr:50S ribosomal protein L15 [Verrucomicrobiota bacterium]
MTSLSSLKDTHRPPKKVQRVGRGLGSKRGKTSCRGGKGDSARRGSQCRFGYEGGQKPLYRKLPIRGFSNERFAREVHVVNLDIIERLYKEGDTVNLETLREKGLAPREVPGGLKILGTGELKKKVKIQAHALSASAKEKLDSAKIAYELLS